jgi:hypothetical protein
MGARRRGFRSSVCNALALSLLFAACEPGGPRAPGVPPLPRVVRTAQGLELHGESALLGTVSMPDEHDFTSGANTASISPPEAPDETSEPFYATPDPLCRTPGLQRSV